MKLIHTTLFFKRIKPQYQKRLPTAFTIFRSVVYAAVVGSIIFFLSAHTHQPKPRCQISYMLYSEKVPSKLDHIMVHMTAQEENEWSLVLSKFFLNRYDTLISHTVKIEDDESWYFKANGKWKPYFGAADTIHYQKFF